MRVSGLGGGCFVVHACKRQHGMMQSKMLLLSEEVVRVEGSECKMCGQEYCRTSCVGSQRASTCLTQVVTCQLDQLVQHVPQTWPPHSHTLHCRPINPTPRSCCGLSHVTHTHSPLTPSMHVTHCTDTPLHRYPPPCNNTMHNTKQQAHTRTHNKHTRAHTHTHTHTNTTNTQTQCIGRVAGQQAW